MTTKKTLSRARRLEERKHGEAAAFVDELARQKTDRANFWREFNALVAQCNRLEERIDAFEADFRRRLDRLEMNHNPKEKTP
jgi:hypothetical protein